MNTMNKKAALCNQLNMNFEEANELFDNESLESMQMARVNGGVVPVIVGAAAVGLQILAALASVVAIAAGTIAIYEWIVEDDGSSAGSDVKAKKEEVEKLGYEVSFTWTADSIVEPDGTKKYGVTMSVFAPTLAQQP